MSKEKPPRGEKEPQARIPSNRMRSYEGSTGRDHREAFRNKGLPNMVSKSLREHMTRDKGPQLKDGHRGTLSREGPIRRVSESLAGITTGSQKAPIIVTNVLQASEDVE